MDWYKVVIRAIEEAKKNGLNEEATVLFVVLQLYGYLRSWEPLLLLSGYRSPDKQRQMRERWDAGDRRGLSVRPAENSQHNTGAAFDVFANNNLEHYGDAATVLGARWGGSFVKHDPYHFDTKNGLKGG